VTESHIQFGKYNIMDQGDSYKITLRLNALQEEAIKAMFAKNDWEYIRVGEYFIAKPISLF